MIGPAPPVKTAAEALCLARGAHPPSQIGESSGSLVPRAAVEALPPAPVASFVRDARDDVHKARVVTPSEVARGG